jgi:hypothetical protein
MKWPRQPLCELTYKIGSGVTPKGGASVYTDSGVSLIRSQNVYNMLFSYPIHKPGSAKCLGGKILIFVQGKHKI